MKGYSLSEIQDRIVCSNCTDTLWDYIKNTDGGVNFETEETPFYAFDCVIKDVNLMAALFARGLTVTNGMSFFFCHESMPEEVFNMAIERGIHKLSSEVWFWKHCMQTPNQSFRLKKMIEATNYIESEDLRQDLVEYAIVRQDYELIISLPHRGCDMNAHLKSGDTPLILACSAPDNFAVICALVNCGARQGTEHRFTDENELARCLDRYQKDNRGWFKNVMFLYRAAGIYIGRSSGGGRYLCLAAKTDDVELLKFMIKQGHHPYSRGQNEETPFEASLRHDSLSVFEYYFYEDIEMGSEWDLDGLLERARQSGATKIHQFVVEKKMEMLSL